MHNMLDIPKCDVIYNLINLIYSHYVKKAISPLFAWASSLNLKLPVTVACHICTEPDSWIIVITPNTVDLLLVVTYGREHWLIWIITYIMHNIKAAGSFDDTEIRFYWY